MKIGILCQVDWQTRNDVSEGPAASIRLDEAAIYSEISLPLHPTSGGPILQSSNFR
jgi:hypothetical protein